jgi:HlyD family secretion protein
LIANTAKDKTSSDAITEFEVRILILASSYQDLVKAGNKFPFRPGMTASVDILTQTKTNALSVPLAAVTTRDPDAKPEGGNNQGGPPDDDGESPPPAADTDKKPEKKKEKTVIFVNENGTAKMVEVKTGISDYDNIEIVSGVSDSTEVVTGPFLAVSKRLKEGDKIKMQEKKEPGKKTE